MQFNIKHIQRDGHGAMTDYSSMADYWRPDLSDRFPARPPTTPQPEYRVLLQPPLHAILGSVVDDASEAVACDAIDFLLRLPAESGQQLAHLGLKNGDALGMALATHRWPLVRPLLAHVLAAGVMQKSKWSGVNMLAVRRYRMLAAWNLLPPTCC